MLQIKALPRPPPRNLGNWWLNIHLPTTRGRSSFLSWAGQVAFSSFKHVETKKGESWPESQGSKEALPGPGLCGVGEDALALESGRPEFESGVDTLVSWLVQASD